MHSWLSVGRLSVGWSVGPQSILWQNGWAVPDAVWGVWGESGLGIGVRTGVHVAQREGWIFGLFSPLAQWFQWPNFQEKCIRLVHEKLRLFQYVQYIIEIYVSLAFQKCTQVRGRCWGLRIICSHVQKTKSSPAILVSMYGRWVKGNRVTFYCSITK